MLTAQEPRSVETEREINLLEGGRILVERRVPAITILAVTVATVLLATLLATPQYESATTLQIERQGPDILTFKEVLGVDPMGYKDFYQTQYKILQSKRVLRIAAENLDLPNDPRYLNRKSPPLKRAYRQIKRLFGKEPAPGGLGLAAAYIGSRMEVTPIRSSHLVKVSCTTHDPELSRDVANAVAEAYEEFSREARYNTTEQASEFLTGEVARLQAEISGLQGGLQDMSAEKEILALSDGTQDIGEQALADISARLTQSRGQLAVAEARHASVRDVSPESLPEVLNSPLINSLKQQYAEAERRHSQMAKRFKPDWPQLNQLEEEMTGTLERARIEAESIARQVRNAALADQRRAAGEVENLQRQVAEQKSEVQRTSRDAIDVASLKAEIETRRNVLSDLVARQSQTEASGMLRETQASNIRVVDRAEAAGTPARPRKMVNLLFSLFLGSGLGVGAAFLLHYLDNTIKTEQDVQRYAPGVTMLGHVPLFEPLRVVYGGTPPGPGEATTEEETEGGSPLSTNPDLASHQAPRSSFAEAFKSLRTSLLLASSETPRQIHITSCEPGDGKSTVAINLATALCQMGRRVLLIDADLRRPRVHKGLDLPNQVGLSTFLTGNATFDEVVQATDVPLLHVIASGPIPPNPSELLDSPRLGDLLGRDAAYDHVIVDSPPVLQVADSMVLATRMAATIIVVRAGKTRRESLSKGFANLRQARVKVVGAVLNAVQERSGYYYRRYDYTYGHVEPGASRPGRSLGNAFGLKGRRRAG